MINLRKWDRIEVALSGVSGKLSVMPKAENLLINRVYKAGVLRRSEVHHSGWVRNLQLTPGDLLSYSLSPDCISPAETWKNQVLVLLGRWESLYLPDVNSKGDCIVDFRCDCIDAQVFLNGQESPHCYRTSLSDVPMILTLVTPSLPLQERPGLRGYGFRAPDLDLFSLVYDTLESLLGPRPQSTVLFSVDVPRPVVRQSALVWPQSVSPSDPANFGLLAHELSHLWWRLDNTKEVWLREGLAHFSHLLALERLFGRAARVSLVSAYRERLRLLARQASGYVLSGMTNDGMYRTR